MSNQKVFTIVLFLFIVYLRLTMANKLDIIFYSKQCEISKQLFNLDIDWGKHFRLISVDSIEARNIFKNSTIPIKIIPTLLIINAKQIEKYEGLKVIEKIQSEIKLPEVKIPSKKPILKTKFNPNAEFKRVELPKPADSSSDSVVTFLGDESDGESDDHKNMARSSKKGFESDPPATKSGDKKNKKGGKSVSEIAAEMQNARKEEIVESQPL